MRLRITMLILILASTLLAEDDTFDWLTRQYTTTAPTTRPVTLTSAPTTKPVPRESVPGTVILSDGTKITGQISTTPQKPLRVWVETEHQYFDVAINEVRRMEAEVLWERVEKEWHFIASGSDVKEYTGRTCPARETMYTLKLKDGREITGSVVAPLYVQTPKEQLLFVLHKRSKGDFGKTLADLKYVKSVEINGDNTP